VLVSADYSQIEMRVLAHITRDVSMISLFKAGGDIYRQLAARMLTKPVATIDDDERNKAKVICLGIVNS